MKGTTFGPPVFSMIESAWQRKDRRPVSSGAIVGVAPTVSVVLRPQMCRCLHGTIGYTAETELAGGLVDEAEHGASHTWGRWVPLTTKVALIRLTPTGSLMRDSHFEGRPSGRVAPSRVTCGGCEKVRVKF